jgi:hypothetical protein
MTINRKEFLAEALRLVWIVWISISFIGPGFLIPNSEKRDQENKMSQKIKFFHDWISNLIKNMERHLDDRQRTRLLEECGRACAKRHAQKEALKFKGDLDGWLGTMKKWLGTDNVQRDMIHVRVSYSKCDHLSFLSDSSPPNKSMDQIWS